MAKQFITSTHGRDRTTPIAVYLIKVAFGVRGVINTVKGYEHNPATNSSDVIAVSC